MSALSLSKKNFKEAVIVEIGNDWLKVFEGRSNDSGVVLNKMFCCRLADIKTPVEEALQNIWKEYKFRKTQVITYIPRHLTTVRIIELPSTNMDEIDSMVDLQIGSQTPYLKDEIVYSYKIIGSAKQGYTEIMLVIATRAIVNERLEALQGAGIKVDKVTFSSEGVAHWFADRNAMQLRSAGAEPIIFIDMDSNFSDLLVFRNGRLNFTKNILIGSNYLAENTEGRLEEFVNELKTSMDVYSEGWQSNSGSKLYFSGAVDCVRDNLDMISQSLSVACEVMDSRENVVIKGRGSEEAEKFKFFSITAAMGTFLKGLGLEFNLLSQEIFVQKVLEEKRKDLAVIGILCAAIILTLSTLVMAHIDYKNTQLTQIKEQSAQIKRVSSEVEKMRTLIELYQGRLDAGGDPLNIFKAIFEATPETVYLTDITIQRKSKLRLKGKAVEMPDVFKYSGALEKLPMLKNVNNTYTTMIRSNKDEFSTEFEITAVYNEFDAEIE